MKTLHRNRLPLLVAFVAVAFAVARPSTGQNTLPPKPAPPAPPAAAVKLEDLVTKLEQQQSVIRQNHDKLAVKFGEVKESLRQANIMSTR